MPVLQAGCEPRFYPSGEVRRYTVSGWSGNEATVEASELKCTIAIKNIPSRHYCLSAPIIIEVKREGSGYLISNSDTGAFAGGEDLQIALDRFYDALVEEYEFLKDNENRLSPSLKRDLLKLEDTIRPC